MQGYKTHLNKIWLTKEAQHLTVKAKEKVQEEGSEVNSTAAIAFTTGLKPELCNQPKTTDRKP